jgi:iron complex outermembrane recepter protein
MLNNQCLISARSLLAVPIRLSRTRTVARLNIAAIRKLALGHPRWVPKLTTRFASKLVLVFLFMLAAEVAAAQTVSGTVRDAQTREPLAGATVSVPGTTIGAVTDLRGQFSLDLSLLRDSRTSSVSSDRGTSTMTSSVPASAGVSMATSAGRTSEQATSGQQITLRISYVGYRTEEISVSRTSDSEVTINLLPEAFLSDAIFVLGHRVDENTPMTFTTLGSDEINRQNAGRDIPWLVQGAPSVVSTSDAGAGVGYTGIRIRGVDDTRINVTINGIPLNDAESHGVFWVNMPDFASSVGSLQIQRGVGTSTNGPAAFGATLNLETSALQTDPFGDFTVTSGSFNTQRTTLRVGTGLLPNAWALEGRLSGIQSDGFIDRATADLSSWYVSASRYGSRDLLKINVFSGQERTYQAWNGIPEARLRSDITGMNFYADQHGLSDAERARLLAADPRTYNMFTYENQVDRYRQDHYQLHYARRLRDNWHLNTALHYTRGLGYFEEFRANDRFSSYGLAPVVVGGTAIARTDLVRRRWLDNHFLGAVVSTEVDLTPTVQLTTGGGWNLYDGDHYGEVIWAGVNDANTRGHRYYDNNGRKRDANLWAKTLVRLSEPLTAYADVQVRDIRYTFLGPVIDNTGVRQDLDQTVTYTFFNPKAGLVYRIEDGQRAYASFAVANKEPVRRELTRSTSASRPRHETLYNLETGYRIDRTAWFAGVNLYHMNYDNQLILTGQLNDVGAAIRANVKDSYRAGIELEGGVRLAEWVSWSGNLALSQNRIPRFTEFVDDFDHGGQAEVVFRDTPIALSPDVVGASVWRFSRGAWAIDLSGKYVGRQYLDNSGLRARSLDPYGVHDLIVSRTLDGRIGAEVRVQVINLLDTTYEANGYTYAWIAGGQENRFNFYYPQAGRHFMLQLNLRF